MLPFYRLQAYFFRSVCVCVFFFIFHLFVIWRRFIHFTYRIALFMGFQVVHRLGLRIFTYSWFLARGIAVASIASGFIVFVADVRIHFFISLCSCFLFCLIQQELRGCFVLKLVFMPFFLYLIHPRNYVFNWEYSHRKTIVTIVFYSYFHYHLAIAHFDYLSHGDSHV